MKKITSYLLIISGMLAMIACDNNHGLKKTKSGLLYKIISDGKGDLVKRGQFLKVNFVQKIRDSITFNSAESMPAYVRVDSALPNYNASEIFGMLRKGDSAVTILLGDSIESKSGHPLPPFIKKKDKITLSFKVLDILPNQEEFMADRVKEAEKEKVRENNAIENYIATHKIDARKATAGTFVKIESVGDGPAVDSGKQVSVLYRGKFFPSGKQFETNMDDPKGQPIKFVIGQGTGIIQGWDDGLRLFKKGGKGTLYVPAYLAYGDQPNGPGQKPFENLIFDIEVIDVTDAPPPAPHQTLNPMAPQMRSQAPKAKAGK
jgi:FKBP-type peptidyl-prolyl cis-trans isomerase FkpA